MLLQIEGKRSVLAATPCYSGRDEMSVMLFRVRDVGDGPPRRKNVQDADSPLSEIDGLE